jgi:hypothetical protein
MNDSSLSGRRVGVIGLGAMGVGMAGSLRRAGCTMGLPVSGRLRPGGDGRDRTRRGGESTCQGLLQVLQGERVIVVECSPDLVGEHALDLLT